MKEKIIKFILGFSFIVPGLHQFAVKESVKSASFSIGFAVGLVMFIWGDGKISSLGYLLVFGTFFGNMIDMINYASKQFAVTLREIHYDLEHIALSMERIAVGLEKTAFMLREINPSVIVLPSARVKVILLLPAPRVYRLLSEPSKKVIILGSREISREIIHLPEGKTV